MIWKRLEDLQAGQDSIRGELVAIRQEQVNPPPPLTCRAWEGEAPLPPMPTSPFDKIVM